GRASLYAVAAAGLLGFLVGGATWARPAGAQPAAARAAAASAHVAPARAAAAPAALDFSQTLPPGQPSAAIADTEYSTRLYGNDPYEEAVAVTRHVYTASQPV